MFCVSWGASGSVCECFCTEEVMYAWGPANHEKDERREEHRCRRPCGDEGTETEGASVTWGLNTSVGVFNYLTNGKKIERNCLLVKDLVMILYFLLCFWVNIDDFHFWVKYSFNKFTSSSSLSPRSLRRCKNQNLLLALHLFWMKGANQSPPPPYTPVTALSSLCTRPLCSRGPNGEKDRERET